MPGISAHQPGSGKCCKWISVGVGEAVGQNDGGLVVLGYGSVIDTGESLSLRTHHERVLFSR